MLVPSWPSKACLMFGTFLMVQWLRLRVLKAGGLSSIPGQGTRSHMLQLRVRTLLLQTLRATAKTQCSNPPQNKQSSPLLEAPLSSSGPVPLLGTDHRHLEVCVYAFSLPSCWGILGPGLGSNFSGSPIREWGGPRQTGHW